MTVPISDPPTPTTINPGEHLLTPDEVSEILGIPVKTLANWRSERSGPLPLRIGAHVRYRRADLAEWVDARVVEAHEWMAS